MTNWLYEYYLMYKLLLFKILSSGASLGSYYSRNLICNCFVLVYLVSINVCLYLLVIFVVSFRIARM
jgi:hypothetical protein